jgi:ADP-heptose:LPS heptosyltransferase/GT2 family glycosyltransferase
MRSLFDDYQTVSNSGLFDPEFYLASNPDLTALNIDPLLHYMESGARDGRDPHGNFDTAFYIEQCRRLGDVPENPLLHFILVGASRGLQPRRDRAGGDISPETNFLAAIDAATLDPDARFGGRGLALQGWAVAASPIVELAVSLGDGGTCIATYGLPRLDVARTYPAFPRADHSGFAIVLPNIPGTIERDVTVTLKARTATGETHDISLPVTIGEPDVTEIVPDASPPWLRSPSMLLHVDHVSVQDDHVLHIAGWAICHAPIVSVQIFLEDERIGAAEYGRAREDVAASYPDFPNSQASGFLFKAHLGSRGSGVKSVKVEAIALSGISRELIVPITIGIPPVAAQDQPHAKQDAHVHCDVVRLTTGGSVALAGWAVPPVPVDMITVAVDGREIGRAEHGLERPDVGNHFPAVAHARNSGFAFRASLGTRFEGEHLVLLRVTSGGAFTEIPLPVLAIDLPEHNTPAPILPLSNEASLKLCVDVPTVIDGAVSMPIRNRLEISGWALAREGVGSIDITLDNDHVLTAHHGIRRIDVQSAFPDWADALASGFTATLPHRMLPKGRHRIGVALRDKAGASTAVEFFVEIEEPPESSGPWSLRRKLPQSEIDLAVHSLNSCAWHPRFALILPVHENDEPNDVRRTVDSVRAQAYRDWTVVLVPQHASATAKRLCRKLTETDEPRRLRTLTRASERRLASLFADDRAHPEGDFLSVLRAGDELSCDALLEVAVATATRRDADFVYGDDRRLNPATGTVDAYFKPQWSPDLLLSTNYVGRLWCARADLVARLETTIGDWQRDGDYDVVLRATELATAVLHVPTVLCQHAQQPPDDAAREIAALKRALDRRSIGGRIEAGRVAATYRLRRDVRTRGLVSIIIPTCAAGGLIQTCIETLRNLTTYRNFEIICIENIPPDQKRWKRWVRANADTVIETKEKFNWSRFNNIAAAKAKGEFLLFLNDDVEIIDPGWLDALLEHAERMEVGVVGPQLLYPDRRVQHAGMFLAHMGKARHAFRYAREDDPGYFGLALTQRNVIAVTGACLMTRRTTFDAIGGFDEAYNVVNNDLDFCLKAWRRGLVTLYTPHATLIHHEQISRSGMADEYDAAAFETIWRNVFVLGDPYFHPRLSKDRDDFSPEWEPTVAYCANHPAMAPDDVRTILVVKLDHIGDCIVAMPAIRRLKRHFPAARIAVLSSKASAAVWSMEPAVEQVIEFEFFHARSQLGQVALDESDLIALRTRLTPLGFDLAIDLRKHPETRHVLQYSGARLLAGFDHRGQFPWLDFALEWSGDQSYVRKRQHTASDLVNLADAVAAACEGQRRPIAAMPPALRSLPPGEHCELFARPIICVHASAGNDMKQWPTEYFAALIDLLVEDGNVNVALVGGNDDRPIADEVVGQVRCSGAVHSLVGRLKLAELPSFIAGCALFVGNDSGPKHIAAGLGIPTVGIHSGVVDAREWGPIGPRAIAIERDMTCSPCYLTKLGDCRRELACLRQLSPGDVFRACKRLVDVASLRNSDHNRDRRVDR